MNIFVTANGVEFVRIASQKLATGYAVIAQREFDPEKHTLFTEPEAPAPPVPPVPPVATAPVVTVQSTTPQVPPAPAATPTAESQAPAAAPDGGTEKPATADETKAAVLKETDPVVLQALREQEFGREKPRKTVLDAIDNRLNALQAAPPAAE